MLKSLLIYLSCLFGSCDTEPQKTPVEPSKPEVSITQGGEIERPIQGNLGSNTAVLSLTIPSQCKRLTKYFLNAENPSLWAAQIYQESTCNQYAKSPYANGAAQITPPTGKGLARGDCSHMGPYRKFDDHWQMTCGLILEEKNEGYAKRKFPQLNYCQTKKMGQKIYNGGYWAVWELQDGGTFEKARQICGKVVLSNGRKRALWACDENYKYPEYISKHQSKFKTLGGTTCV